MVEAASAAAALELVTASDPPEAIVCDVMMPGMNEMEFYQARGQAAPGLQGCLVFLTGASQDPDIHTRIEQLGVPLLGKLDDLQLVVVDAIRVILFRRSQG